MKLYDIALFVHIVGLIAMFGAFVLYARGGRGYARPLIWTRYAPG
jgi:hypothetical protein